MTVLGHSVGFGFEQTTGDAIALIEFIQIGCGSRRRSVIIPQR